MIPKRCGSPAGIFSQFVELKNLEKLEKKMVEVSVSLPPPHPPRETKVTLRNKLTVSMGVDWIRGPPDWGLLDSGSVGLGGTRLGST